MFFDNGSIGSIKDLSQNIEYSSVKILELVNKRQKQFINDGITSNKIVALLNNNTIDFFIDFVALRNMRAIPFPLSEKLKNILKIFSSVGVEYYINTDNTVHKTRFSNVDSSLSNICLILLSSGTNGKQKAIWITEKLLLNRINEIHKMQSDSIENALCILPTSFGHGLIANCLSVLKYNKRLVLLKEFDPSYYYKIDQIIHNESINFFSSVPSHFELFRKIGIKKIGPQKNNFEIHCSSASLRKNTYSYMRNILGDIEVKYHYGMTELASWMTQLTLPKNPDFFEDGCVGAGYGIDFHCSDSDILISKLPSDIRMIDILTSEITSAKEGEVFFTGDVGYIKNSKIYLSGRKGDFINKSGLKISPFYIEEIILKNTSVENCVIFPLDDFIHGETIAALIVLKHNTSANQDSIKLFCHENLSGLYIPKYYFFEESIPQHINGKISRKDLKNFYSKKMMEIK